MPPAIWKLPVVVILASFLLAGCWDMKEINQLAIVNLIGVDTHKNTDKQELYYQVINPKGIATQAGAPEKATVYTYRFIERLGDQFEDISPDVIPRQLFTQHYQAIVVSERYAKSGLRELLNFKEGHPERGTNVYLLVSDAPIDRIMDSFIPLEPLPGRSMRSIIENQSEMTGRISTHTRMKDLIENMETGQISVFPIITYIGEKSSENSNRLEHIQGTNGNIALLGGALFIHDRMVGKLTKDEMKWYNLLNRKHERFLETLVINGESVQVKTLNTRLMKKLELHGEELILHIQIFANTNLIFNDQKVPTTTTLFNQIEAEFNQRIQKESQRFIEDSRKKGWDVLGIQYLLHLKKGAQWKRLAEDKDRWKKVKVVISSHNKIETIGSLISPYKGE
ncbi:Ger(x)C family spore germination protein [Brevibacillus centrosporus]|uniref:Ger(x)C family spore germination protein n=1 Tax=Brevibacillus centrosporus TaxID=54910 RepID=UPI000F0A514D|nr:Ger(x)C family spore germination protein [Brevibacillus centrosporus]MEC2131367.1 Ger(x)C family spore germination protein [Brevibacillus centrosporus]RNB72606.1 Ger(x)C family spore germination protein [Brevibacillus centrosporus]GED31578.1 hypothetical protein BCE02nite_27190 [Brevibacillus centrosporus]